MGKTCGGQLATLAGAGKEAWDSMHRIVGTKGIGTGSWADSLDDWLANQPCLPIESVLAGPVGGWIGAMFRESCECCCRREVGYSTNALFFK
jgi:hypothetical protein